MCIAGKAFNGALARGRCEQQLAKEEARLLLTKALIDCVVGLMEVRILPEGLQVLSRAGWVEADRLQVLGNKLGRRSLFGLLSFFGGSCLRGTRSGASEGHGGRKVAAAVGM